LEKLHPMKDRMREDMHRRAQVAEGRLQAARFWIERIEDHAAKEKDFYLRAIVRYAKNEINK
jgi:hypothetical protein